MPRPKKLPVGLWRRGHTYYARFRNKGREVRIRLSGDFDTACTLLNEMKARADRGDFGIVDNDYPWQELRAEFLRWAKQSIRRPDQYVADLDRFEAFMRVQSVRQISQAVVLSYREWRLGQPVVVHSRKTGAAPLARKVSPRTINREVGTLVNMLNRAVGWGRIGSNPLIGLKPLSHDRPTKQRRPLSGDEVQRLFDSSPAYLVPVWRMFTCTGMRLAELTSLKFSDVDFDRQSVTVRAEVAKSKKAREIPLDDSMFTMLKRLKEFAADRRSVLGKSSAETNAQREAFSSDHVFVTTANTPHRSGLLKLFYAACKRAGIEDAVSGGSVDLHSLRVSFATLALENGASPKAVQAILGHSTLQMTMSVYAKATEKAKREAISALPFANSSVPDHVISVQKAHMVRTSRPKVQEVMVSQQLAMTGA